MVACVHQLSGDKQANQRRLWLIEFSCCHLEHAELMLHSSEPFSSSENTSLWHLGSILFSLPVSLLLGKNFLAQVGLIGLHRTQLDSQKVHFQVKISVFQHGIPITSGYCSYGTLSIHSTDVVSSFCCFITLTKSKKKVSKMLILLNLTFHLNYLKTGRN